MELFQDDCYQVYVRVDAPHRMHPEAIEEPLAECNSYEEARRVKFQSNRDCVIRYMGSVGGGD